MPRRRRSGRLTVALNGRVVGQLERAPNGAVSFQYTPDWLADDQRAIPVSLSLPLREERYTGAEVMAFFDNLLPDNADIRRMVAAKVGADGTDAYSLLDKIGRDCVGALQFVRDGEEVLKPGPPRTLPLTDADVADIVRNLATTPLGIRTDAGRDFRISIAGAQEKTALVYADGWGLPQGFTPTTHIIKPALGRLPNGLDMTLSVENEHFCLTLCAALGLDAAGSLILDVDGLRVLAVERFDRVNTRDGRLLRIPQEDFCQALSVPSVRKYNSEGGPGILECLDLLNGSDNAERDRAAFLKAQIVFWLIGATDGHAKNFSIFLSPGGRFRMTPLYDVMSVQPCYDARQLRRREFRLAMAVGNSRHYPVDKVRPHHFLESAAAAGVAKETVLGIFSELRASHDAAFARAAEMMPKGFPMQLVDSIQSAMARRLEQSVNLT